MPIFRISILLFATLFFVSVCPAEECGEKFLESLKAKQYADAVTLFSDDLRFQCSEQQLQKILCDIEESGVTVPGQMRNRRNETVTGRLTSFDPPKSTEHSNGTLWNSVLHFENAAVAVRMAIKTDEENGTKITAFELLPIPGEPMPEEAGSIFNGIEIGRILGFDGSIRVDFFNADGKKPKVGAGLNDVVMLFQKIDQLPPEADSNETSGINSNYWTDPKDGSHWIAFFPDDRYCVKDYEAWKNGVYHISGLPVGTYRIAFCNAGFVTDPNVIGYVGLTDPISVGKDSKIINVAQKVVQGGTLRILAADVDSGEQIEGVYIAQLTCKQVPAHIAGSWTRYNSRNAVAHLFPGQYSFSLKSYARQPTDRVYTPVEEKYETEIAEGKETVVEVKLRSRPQTEKELNRRWQFIVAGTVQDLEGKPLPNAKISITGFVGHRPGEASIIADENGRYSFRFSKDMVSGMMILRSDKATPEKPDILEIAVSAEKSGFVWKGVRTAEGKIVSDQFLTKDQRGIFSRSDFHKMFCVEPEPTGKVKEKYDSLNAVYPLKATEINIVMQPSVHFRGTVKFDEEPSKPKKNERIWNRAEVIFDLPRAETASWQPVFSGKLNGEANEAASRNDRFEIDALPQDIGALFRVSTLPPATWKDDAVVTQTDFFKLPPAGEYDAVLNWKTEEKYGVRLHRLCVESLTDADGQHFSTETIKPSNPTEYLFNRWTMTGTVHDDLGKPIADADVEFYRHDGWQPVLDKTAKTDAEGKYEAEIASRNRYPYGDKLHGMKDGELYIVRVQKSGFLQTKLNEGIVLFLSDEEKPEEKSFSFQKLSAEQIIPPRTAETVDAVLNRNPVIEGILLDNDGKPMPGASLYLQSDDKIDRKVRDQLKLNHFDFSKTDRQGIFRFENIPAKTPFWFLLDGKPDERDIFRTNNIVFEPGEKYEIKLRFRRESNGSRRLMLESVRNSGNDDIASKIVTDDLRTRPLLGDEETKNGRKILRKTLNAVSPMIEIEAKEIESVSYTFYLAEEANEYNVDWHTGQQTSLRMGITFQDSIQNLNDSLEEIKFRAVEHVTKNGENEIRLLTTQQKHFTAGNGVINSWKGYIQSWYDGAEFVLDAETFLPKRTKTNRSETEYFDWVPFGDSQNGQFVPKRIRCQSGELTFDFRFKIHDGVWLFDRSVMQDGADEKTICRIENVKVKRVVWASEADENRVRKLLRKYSVANRYWLNWFPKDLPKFGYTFHRKGADSEVLSYEAIKAADNWYAEFYRKGISYIGVSRLLVIDIDSLRCTRVIEDTVAGTLEFDFVLKHEWMNAVGNGISGTWLGWFNGGVGKGTAIFDTKTNTVKEIRTKDYDERFFDYDELKPDQYVPRRIVIDYHKGNKDENDKMFFDFRFKIYEPNLWLFDRSVDLNEKEPLVWIDNVIVDEKNGVEKKSFNHLQEP